VAEGRVGLAAPIARNGHVAACLSLIVVAGGWDKKKVSAVIPDVVGAAGRISRSFGKEVPVISR
jgi:DNA-binding IclR family transcriptional regulator